MSIFEHRTRGATVLPPVALVIASEVVATSLDRLGFDCLHPPFTALLVEAHDSYPFDKITCQDPSSGDQMGRDEDFSACEAQPVRSHVRCFPKVATNVGARQLIRGLDVNDPRSLAVLRVMLRKPDRNGIGHRRIGILLARKGITMNHKKLYRLYREEGLSVRRRRGRKRARGSRSPMPQALRPNQRWSMDFVSDTFGASRRFRILAVNDDCCRENLALIADTSISGDRVTRELDALVRLYGRPESIVTDNGTEFTSKVKHDPRRVAVAKEHLLRSAMAHHTPT